MAWDVLGWKEWGEWRLNHPEIAIDIHRSGFTNFGWGSAMWHCGNPNDIQWQMNWGWFIPPISGKVGDCVSLSFFLSLGNLADFHHLWLFWKFWNTLSILMPWRTLLFLYSFIRIFLYSLLRIPPFTWSFHFRRTSVACAAEASVKKPSGEIFWARQRRALSPLCRCQHFGRWEVRSWGILSRCRWCINLWNY